MKIPFLRVAAMATLVGSMMATSCQTNKSISQKSATGYEDIQKDECQLYAEQNPVIRAAASGEHFKEMTARNIAETQARAQFARAIKSAIKASTEESANSNTAYNSDVNGANQATEQNAGGNDYAQSIADEEVVNTTVVKTHPMFNPTTKQYKYWVCVEYNQGVSVLSTSIAKKVQKLSADRKLEMNFDFEQYRKRIEAELEKKKNGQ